jgi:hypothetical protein
MEPFIVFDDTSYSNKPFDVMPGAHNIKTASHGNIWSGPYPHYNTDRASEEHVRKFAKAIAKDPRMVVFDIEHWSFAPENVDETTRKLSEVIDWFHDEAPFVRCGYYMLMPHRDYWTPAEFQRLQNKVDKGEIKETHPGYKQRLEKLWKWMSKNGRLKVGQDAETGRFIPEGLADKVDCVFPSLYAFYDNIEGWKNYARWNIKEARKYQKQVYPYIWPHYHNSNKEKNGQYLGDEYWEAIMETCMEHADGVVIWGGWKSEFSQNNSWWDVTVKSMRKKFPGWGKTIQEISQEPDIDKPKENEQGAKPSEEKAEAEKSKVDKEKAAVEKAKADRERAAEKARIYIKQKQREKKVKQFVESSSKKRSAKKTEPKKKGWFGWFK